MTTPMPIRVSIVVVLRNDGDQRRARRGRRARRQANVRQSSRMRTRAPASVLRIDPQRRRLVRRTSAMMRTRDGAAGSAVDPVAPTWATVARGDRRPPAGAEPRVARRAHAGVGRRCSSAPSSPPSCCATPSSPPTARSAGSSPAPSSPCCIDPLVDFVDRVLPRWLSVIVVLLAVAGASSPASRSASPTTCSTRSTSCRRARREAAAGARGALRLGAPTSASPIACRRSSTTSTSGSARTPCRGRGDRADLRRDRAS